MEQVAYAMLLSPSMKPVLFLLFLCLVPALADRLLVARPVYAAIAAAQDTTGDDPSHGSSERTTMAHTRSWLCGG
jgi:hypothetical protein